MLCNRWVCETQGESWGEGEWLFSFEGSRDCQGVKRLPCKHKDQSLDLQSTWMSHSMEAHLWPKDQEAETADPWDKLASHNRQARDYRYMQAPWLQHRRQKVMQEDTLACVWARAHICTHTRCHTHMNIPHMHKHTYHKHIQKAREKERKGERKAGPQAGRLVGFSRGHRSLVTVIKLRFTWKDPILRQDCHSAKGWAGGKVWTQFSGQLYNNAGTLRASVHFLWQWLSPL